MKKPTFTDTLKPALDPEPSEPAKVIDGRVNTTMRISPEGLRAIKQVALDEGMKANDLVLEGVELMLSLRGKKMQLRK